jgi:mannosyltransferase OCH1-like enzyme
MEQLCIRSFLAHGHSFQLYVYGDVKNIPEGTTVKDGNAILSHTEFFVPETGYCRGSPSAFSNIFRYALLYKKGRMWVDMDVVCLRPFDFREEFVFASQRQPDGSTVVNANVIGAAPHSPIMKQCFEEASALRQRFMKPEESLAVLTGPVLLDRAVRDHALEKFVRAPETFCPVPYWEMKHLTNPAYQLPVTDQTYAVHLWHENWRQWRKSWKWLNPLIGREKTKRYSSRTPYGQLQERYLVTS